MHAIITLRYRFISSSNPGVNGLHDLLVPPPRPPARSRRPHRDPGGRQGAARRGRAARGHHGGHRAACRCRQAHDLSPLAQRPGRGHGGLSRDGRIAGGGGGARGAARWAARPARRHRRRLRRADRAQRQGDDRGEPGRDRARQGVPQPVHRRQPRATGGRCWSGRSRPASCAPTSTSRSRSIWSTARSTTVCSSATRRWTALHRRDPRPGAVRGLAR